MRILVVEDQDSIRSMISTLMRARGHEVVAVHNGSMALQHIAQFPPDAVLLDLMMPGPFGGIEVCKRVRSNPETARLPIVVVSAAAEDASRQEARAAGATAYHTKPFSPKALLQEIDQLCVAERPLGNHN